MRLLTLCFAALVLVAACGDDDTAPASSGETRPATTEETTTSTTSEPSMTSTTEAGGGVELSQSCTSPDGFTISYPGDWEAVSDCGQFGPAPLEEPEPATDERTGVISAFVDPVPFEQVSTPADTEQARARTSVDGFPAVRIESVTSGEGLYPAGTEAVRWMVDLSMGPDDGPGTLFVTAFDLGYDIDFDDAVPVLDAMARSIEIEVATPRGG